MNNDFFKSLERSISSSRISTYKSNGHTEIETIADYVLNAKISQNFYFLLQNLEVSLRNAIYDSFKKHIQHCLIYNTSLSNLPPCLHSY